MGWLRSGALPKTSPAASIEGRATAGRLVVVSGSSPSAALSSGAPSSLDASPALAALRAAARGLYTVGATRSGDSIAAHCVWACV